MSRAEITVDQVDTTDGRLILDVREDDEWDDGHIADAVHIPLGELPDRSADLPRDRPIVCVCRSGNRSGKATDLLADQRFDAINMSGGMLAWVDADRPVVSTSA